MRLSEYCTSQDVDRAIAVTVDSFVGAQKVSCRKALGRAFAKYVIFLPPPFSSIKSPTLVLYNILRTLWVILLWARSKEPLFPALD